MNPRQNLACPVCGAPNECAPAQSGDFATPCWCTGIAPDPAALAALPADAINQACLCRRCLCDGNFVRQQLADRVVP